MLWSTALASLVCVALGSFALDSFAFLLFITSFDSILGPNGKKVQDVEGASFDQVMAVNVKGTFNMTKACIPHMVEKNYGRILLIASIAGKEGNAVCFALAA